MAVKIVNPISGGGGGNGDRGGIFAPPPFINRLAKYLGMDRVKTISSMNVNKEI